MPWLVVLVIGAILFCIDGPLPFGDAIAVVMLVLKSIATLRSQNNHQIGNGRR